VSSPKQVSDSEIAGTTRDHFRVDSDSKAMPTLLS
jgi:hypothetical protein